MNERTEAHLRNALSTVDDVSLPSLDVVGARVAGVQRRQARRRRAAGSVGSVGVLALAAMLVWNTSSGPAQVTSGDGGPTTTAASEPGTSVSVSTTWVDPGSTGVYWAPVPTDPRGGYTGAAVAWTGTEALVVGGIAETGLQLDGVTAYDPSTKFWRTVSTEPVPLLAPIVEWAGDRLLAIGWSDLHRRTVAATLDPTSGEWTIGSPMPFDFKSSTSTPHAWTGEELLLLSGATPVAYDATSDAWRVLTASPLDARFDAASVWSGEEWIVWGGYSNELLGALGDGAAYDPVADTWRSLAESPLSARLVDGVWTGSEMVLLAGRSSNSNGMMAYGDGAAYDPVADAWRSLADGPAHPGAQLVYAEPWVLFFAKGTYSVYDVGSDRWLESVTGAGVCFDASSPVWTDQSLLMLGCYDGATGGASFTPPD